MRRRTGEFVGIALGLTGIALLVALASHNPADPSLNTATTRGTSNLAGPPGAVVSDLLLQGFGLAGALPGIAMLTWCWRIASHRGIGSPALRILALLSAMPVLGATFSALSAPGGHSAIIWPTVAGPGGAIGQLLAGAVLSAARPLLGPWAPFVLGPLGLILALGLTLLTLGLSFGEWRVVGSVAGRTAGSAARHSMSGGRSAAGLFGHIGGGIAGAISPVIRRIGSRSEESEPPFEHSEPTLHTSPAGPATGMILRPFMPVAEPAAMLDKRPAKAAKTPPGKAAPEQIPLPLTENGWRFPPLSLLTPAPARGAVGPTADALEAVARRLETVLADYGVQGRIVAYRAGPVVTLYELEPAPGIRSARVIGLADDIARTLAVAAVRIATVTGRNVIGIEVPHEKRETVYLSEVLAAEAAQKHPGRLTLALGKDIGG